jgi:hypothetical protein
MWFGRSQLPDRLAIAGAFRQDRAPGSVGLVAVAALRGQDRQVPTGQMAVDSQVDALIRVGAIERQDSPPAIFGDGTGRGESESGGVACPSMGVISRQKEVTSNWDARSLESQGIPRESTTKSCVVSAAYPSTAARVKAFVEQEGGCRATFFNSRCKLGVGSRSGNEAGSALKDELPGRIDYLVPQW